MGWECETRTKYPARTTVLRKISGFHDLIQLPGRLREKMLALLTLATAPEPRDDALVFHHAAVLAQR
jgi:hypothetical protein